MIAELREQCAERGFDLCHPIHTKWYNDMIEEEGLLESGALMELPQPPGSSSLHMTTNGGCTNEDYNDCNGRDVRELPSQRSEHQNRHNAVLIGNTKTIWIKFISWLSSKYRSAIAMAGNTRTTETYDDKCELLNQLLHDNPFDTFITESLSDVFQSCFHYSSFTSQGLRSYEVFWSHGLRHKIDLKPEPSSETTPKSSTSSSSSFLVSMQRLAKVSGEYWHDDVGTKLCVHPTYGTWHAFRALVVFHAEDRNECTSGLRRNNPSQLQIPSPYPMCPCPVSQNEIEKAKEVLNYALQVMSGGRNNVDDNEDSNHDKDENELTSGGVCVVSKGKNNANQELCQYLHKSTSSGSDWLKVSPSMRPWIQLRNCISVGCDEFKYCDNQLLYHYTKDVEILKNELRALCTSSS